MHQRLVPLIAAAAAITTSQALAADDPPGKIAYSETGAHGMGQVRWHLRTDGRGRYESRGSASDGVIRVKLDVGAAGFQTISAMLQRLEGRGEIPCDAIATDQARGSLTFHRDGRRLTTYIDPGCRASRDDDAFRLMNAANLTILDGAGTDRWHNGIVSGR